MGARQLIGSNPTEALRVCDELLGIIPPDSQASVLPACAWFFVSVLRYEISTIPPDSQVIASAVWR